MSFLRNYWYVAAHAHELTGDQLLPRQFLNEQVVLFRDEEGKVCALQDRCPHRFAPLHRGKLRIGRLECAYHGLQFNGAGRCVLNPHGNAVPRRAQVKSFPIKESQGLIWLWMGDPDAAPACEIPQYQSLDSQRWKILRGYIRIEAHYLLETDNILDLSHIEFIHPGFFGSEAIRRAKTGAAQSGQTIHSNRLTHSEILPPFLDKSFGAQGRPVDRWLNARWDPPALIELDVGATLTGRPLSEGRSIPGCHFFTPATETSTHYFWSLSRDYERENEALDAEITAGVRYAFEEQDQPIIEAQQAVIGCADLLDLQPVMLSGDSAAVRVRRVVGKLLQEEAQVDSSKRSASAKDPHEID